MDDRVRQVHLVRRGGEVRLARAVKALVPSAVAGIHNGGPERRERRSGLPRTTFCACGSSKTREARLCRACYNMLTHEGSKALRRKRTRSAELVPPVIPDGEVAMGSHVRATPHAHQQPPVQRWVKWPDGSWTKRKETTL